MSLTETILFSQNLNEVVQELKKTPDLEAIDEYGFTPLIESVIANKTSITQLLLKEGADVDSKDVTGRTALHWAVDNNNLTICRLLLENGANANAYTFHGQPLLIFPLLREQNELKQLLYQFHAKLSFAQDFINVKLLGHRYALYGQADIITPDNQFIAIDYEGFFLEFTINIIYDSLKRYFKHFSARHFHDLQKEKKTLIRAFETAVLLFQYQKYTVNFEQIDTEITALLEQELLLLPIAYEGHAISFIKYRNFLVRCDRSKDSLKTGHIIIYRINNSKNWNNAFIKRFLYEKQSRYFITEGLNTLLDLERMMIIPINAQLVGNCSWANIESSILAILYIINFNEYQPLTKIKLQRKAHLFYESWLQWDKDRTLEQCVQEFQDANLQRKATIAMTLGAILMQVCRYDSTDSVTIAKKLIPLLITSQYLYILKSYAKVYWKDRRTEEGYNLMQLLDYFGVAI